MKHGPICIIPSRIFHLEGIEPYDVAVLAALAAYANKEGYCFPHQSTIAALLKRHRTCISRCLVKLERLGVLSSRDRGGRGKTYKIFYDHLHHSPGVIPSHTTGADATNQVCVRHTQKDKDKDDSQLNATASGVTEYDFEEKFGVRLAPAAQGLNLERVFSIFFKFKLDAESAQLVLLEFQATSDSGKMKTDPFDTLAALANLASNSRLNLSKRGEKVRQESGPLWT